MLGIETSCDDTAAAVVTDRLEILSNVVSRQLDAHARYGGVVPEIAGRVHVAEVIPVISQALDGAGVRGRDLTAIAVTSGPGLVGSLLVGMAAAKGLALAWKKPLLSINHLEGHLASASLGEAPVEYPALVLLVSGGHTLLARVHGPGRSVVLGRTRDDSAGEAYDKVARMLGLPYPGGPAIDRLAAAGRDVLGFPRPMAGRGLDFSFSGLKTAVANRLREPDGWTPEDVAASFAAAVVDVLMEKLGLALTEHAYASVAVVGGVAASPPLRARLATLGATHGVRVCLPPLRLATDNGAMIAAAAWDRLAHDGGDRLDFGVAPRQGLPEAADVTAH